MAYARKNASARKAPRAPSARPAAPSSVTHSRRQAIVTEYMGPTNSRGSRIKAMAESGSVTVPYDYALNPDGNHAAAAMALADKFGWDGRWVGGAFDNGYVFVDVSRT